jgi:hypothetical protein
MRGEGGRSEGKGKDPLALLKHNHDITTVTSFTLIKMTNMFHPHWVIFRGTSLFALQHFICASALYLRFSMLLQAVHYYSDYYLWYIQNI